MAGGTELRAALEEPAWAALRDCGTVVDLDVADDRRAAEEAAAVLRRDNYDGVLVGPIVPMGSRPLAISKLGPGARS